MKGRITGRIVKNDEHDKYAKMSALLFISGLFSKGLIFKDSGGFLAPFVGLNFWSPNFVQMWSN